MEIILYIITSVIAIIYSIAVWGHKDYWEGVFEKSIKTLIIWTVQFMIFIALCFAIGSTIQLFLEKKVVSEYQEIVSLNNK